MNAAGRHSTKGEFGANWPIVLTASMGMALSASMVVMQGVMMIPLEHEFGWSRALISSGGLIVSVLGLLLSAVAGYAIDRIGARKIGIAVAVAMSGVLIFLAATTSIWHWWLLWSIYGLAATATSAVWLKPVSTRFDRKRGLAIAITMAGTGLSAALLPVTTSYIIAHFGWRSAYTVVGVIFALVTIPLTLTVWKEEEPIADGPAPADLRGMTVSQGFRSPNFYLIIACMTISMFAWVAVIVNLVPILVSLNVSAMEAAAIAGTQGLSGIGGRFIGGWALDRIAAKWLVVGATLCTVMLPIVLLIDPGSVPMIFAAVIFCSAMSGAKYAGIVYLVSRHFGPKSFGTLYGAVSTAPALAAGVGPMIASYIFDQTKSYSMAMWIMLPSMAAAALCAASLGRYPNFED